MSYEPIQHGPQSIAEHWRILVRRCKFFWTGENERRLVFIACFPKSGSTFLMRTMGELTGFPRVHPAVALGATEQEFCEHALQAIRFQDGVCHQHVKATKRNLELAKKHGIRPVVLVRNIFDVVPSLIDHFHNLSTEFPTGAVPESFCNWTRERQELYVTTFHLPWYFNFLTTWGSVEPAQDVRWVTYEQLIQEPIATLTALCNFWDLEKGSHEIECALEAVKGHNTRKNKAIAGRGKALCPEAIDRITNMGAIARLPARISDLVGLSSQSESGDVK
jgi:hypothetical protein